MTKTRQPDTTRTALLDAARRMLKTNPSLSLNAVAQEAGVSKGGLMHHFPSKEHLLVALAHDLTDAFREQLTLAKAQEIAEHGDAPGAWLRAYIEVSFTDDETFLPVIAAFSQLTSFPDLFSRLKEAQHFLVSEAGADGLPAPRAHAIRLACDGLWFSYNAGVFEFDEAQRSALKEELLRWTRS